MSRPSSSLSIISLRSIHCSVANNKKAIFKPKIARTKPVKTPSVLALDNFDFYYGPLYGDQWTSIRLGLLTPNKFIAVLNRFSQDVEVNQSILESIGTQNLMKSLVSGREINDARIKEKEAKVMKQPMKDMEGSVWTEDEAFGQGKIEEKEKEVRMEERSKKLSLSIICSEMIFFRKLINLI